MVSLMLAGAAFAGGTRVKLPVPLHPHVSDTNTCAVVTGADLDIPNTTVDDGRWEVSCKAEDGKYVVCLRVMATNVPRKPLPLRCEGDRTWLEVKPMVAYDRDDDPRDGVYVVKGTRESMFFHTDLPAADGVMDKGQCAVRVAPLTTGGTLSAFIVRPGRRIRKDRVCTLTAEDGQTFTVPIHVVRKVEDLPGFGQPPP